MWGRSHHLGADLDGSPAAIEQKFEPVRVPDYGRERWLARIAYLRPTSLEPVFTFGADKPAFPGLSIGENRRISDSWKCGQAAGDHLSDWSGRVGYLGSCPRLMSSNGVEPSRPLFNCPTTEGWSCGGATPAEDRVREDGRELRRAVRIDGSTIVPAQAGTQQLKGCRELLPQLFNSRLPACGGRRDRPSSDAWL